MSAESSFDPFARGPFAVGVTTETVVDPGRESRRLTCEIWYPARARDAGARAAAAARDRFALLDGTEVEQDATRAAPALPGPHPLVVFSHTSGGHRRQSTFLTTHLASHGFVVAAPDHAGSTDADRARRVASGRTLAPAEIDTLVAELIAARVPDLVAVLDDLLSGARAERIGALDPARVAAIGWSFGGWAALALPERDPRIGAVVAMVPGGSSNPLPGIIPARLTFAWSREVPTLYLAAENDRYTPLDGIVGICERTPSARRLVVLCGADHDHFGDRFDTPAPFTPEAAHAFVRALALAHLEAALNDLPAARAFLAGDLEASLRARGVRARDTGAVGAAPRRPAP